MPVNRFGSHVVNGQLVDEPPSSAIYPVDMGPQYRGPGMYQSRNSYAIPPVVPEPVSSSTAMGSVTAGSVSGHSPFHPTQGTIIFALVALTAGLFMLHYIHYGAD